MLFMIFLDISCSLLSLNLNEMNEGHIWVSDVLFYEKDYVFHHLSYICQLSKTTYDSISIRSAIALA